MPVVFVFQGGFVEAAWVRRAGGVFRHGVGHGRRGARFGRGTRGRSHDRSGMEVRDDGRR